MQCTLTKSGQNSPFNNCVPGFQVFEQEQGKGNLIMLQMLLFFQM